MHGRIIQHHEHRVEMFSEEYLDLFFVGERGAGWAEDVEDLNRNMALD